MDNYGRVICKYTNHIPLAWEDQGDGTYDFSSDYYSPYVVGEVYGDFMCITNNKCSDGYYFNPAGISTGESYSGFLYENQSATKPYCNKAVGCVDLRAKFYSGYTTEVKNYGCSTGIPDDATGTNDPDNYRPASCRDAEGEYDYFTGSFCLRPINTNGKYYFYDDNSFENLVIMGILRRYNNWDPENDYEEYSDKIYPYSSTSEYFDSDFEALFTEYVPGKFVSSDSDTCRPDYDTLMYTCASAKGNQYGYANTNSYTVQFLAHYHSKLNTPYRNDSYDAPKVGRSGQQVVGGNETYVYDMPTACPYYTQGFDTIYSGRVVDKRVMTYEPDTFSVCMKTTCASGYVKVPLKYPYVDSDNYLVLGDKANLNETSFYVVVGTDEIIANGSYGDYPYYTDGVIDGPSACIKEEYCNGTKTISGKTEVGNNGSGYINYIYTGTWCIK